MERPDPGESAVARIIRMRGQRANRKPGTKRQFNPQAIDAGDTIIAADKAWELRVLGVSQARRRYWAGAKELSRFKRKMTMVEMEGPCMECAEQHTFWRALANINGLVRCQECMDARRREQAQQKALKKAAEVARLRAAEEALMQSTTTIPMCGFKENEAISLPSTPPSNLCSSLLGGEQEEGGL